jgi:hypothetical protein
MLGTSPSMTNEGAMSLFKKTHAHTSQVIFTHEPWWAYAPAYTATRSPRLKQ